MGSQLAHRSRMSVSPNLCREQLLGYDVYSRGMQPLIDDIVGTIAADGPPAAAWLACLNPHSYAVARANGLFRSALRSARWLVPDGAGIVLASRLLSGSIGERVSGPDVFLAVSAALNARGPFTTLFMGSGEATLALIRERYSADFPNARLVHTHSPPFRDQFSLAEVAEMQYVINQHRPDVLWLGMTAPKQEVLLAQLSQSGTFRFAAGIGAAFDFYVGTVRRSPPVFRRLGLEWLPRLVQQPRRLWRRMFVSAPIFLMDVARDALRLGRFGA